MTFIKTITPARSPLRGIFTQVFHICSTKMSCELVLNEDVKEILKSMIKMDGRKVSCIRDLYDTLTIEYDFTNDNELTQWVKGQSVILLIYHF